MAAIRSVMRNLRMKSYAGPLAAQRRFLNLHEYQSLELFNKFGVGIPTIQTIANLNELEAAYKNVAFNKEGKEVGVVVKAQVLAGGRGLGYFKKDDGSKGLQGGVHVIKDTGEKGMAELKGFAEQMLGHTLVTKQTGEAGKPCNKLLLAQKFKIVNEKYFAILMDRGSGGPILIGSKVGGTSIEDIAEADPTAIIRLPVDIMKGLTDADARGMVEQMGWTGAQADDGVKCVKGLYDAFISSDCTMVEINPMAELADGSVVVADAKVGFDDNAFFRQKEIFDQRDLTQEDARDVEAAKWDLNYIGLDGRVACLVNGAGLAMATMDLLNFTGQRMKMDGRPANFLDVGGSAEVGQIKAAFEIVESDERTRACLINIFGGIMRCDVVAEGVVQACRELAVSTPIVIRLVGTNVEEGKRIIKESGLTVFSCDDLNMAAEVAVKLGNVDMVKDSSGKMVPHPDHVAEIAEALDKFNAAG